jgi:hypothetical protein
MTAQVQYAGYADLLGNGPDPGGLYLMLTLRGPGPGTHCNEMTLNAAYTYRMYGDLPATASTIPAARADPRCHPGMVGGERRMCDRRHTDTDREAGSQH